MFTSQTQSRIDIGYEVTITAGHRQTVSLLGSPHETAPLAYRKGFVSLGIETLEERATPGKWGTGTGGIVTKR